MNSEEYFEGIEREVKRAFEVGKEARAKGIDPVAQVEVPIATSLAERAVGLISILYPQLNDARIVNRILELEKEHGQLNMAVPFKIAEEIAREKFCKFTSLIEAIEAGIRVGFSYITLGVVSSPIEGFTGLKLGKTRNGEDYFIAYFSGPIRSAGTTAACMALMLIDYLRETFGFAKYDATEDEIRRYITENYDYHERTDLHLQYLPTEEEIDFLARNLPIQISGEPTIEKEVSNYKDLKRIETNFIRGGMCLIFSEGLAQKAQKGLRLLRGLQEKGFKTTGWEFLDEYLRIHKKREKGSTDASPTYIKDIVAGRPIFSHPSRSGGFRFRYGRTRINGFSAAAIHPATMAITDCFLSLGTQLKIEKPTKGCALGVCDEIDGPIVKLKNGSVKKLGDFDEARRIYNDVEEIIYLGDILFSFGDVANRNYELLKAGYVEEWWALELKKKLGVKELGFDKRKVGIDLAIEMSRKYEIPLHPNYIYYWHEINYEGFLSLLDWLSHGQITESRIILPYSLKDKERFAKGKRALELAGCEHKVTVENVVLSERDTKTLAINLGLDILNYNLSDAIDIVAKKVSGGGERSILETVNEISKFKIKDKSGTFIGARMGRPEKAKLRKLVGNPHVLFPVGREGGRLRSVQAACEVGKVQGEFPAFYCENCKQERIYGRCEVCGGFCVRKGYCKICEQETKGKCIEHGNTAIVNFKKGEIDIKHYFDVARKMLGLNNDEVPLVKGVRGTSNLGHDCENLAKGLLRAKHNLNVNKDGTIRYDMTEMPITHFKAREIGTSVEKLREIGYDKDMFGEDLTNGEQIIEIMPHDIILPSCPESGDERADDVFVKVSKFIDDELEKVYGVKRFYNIEKKEGLIGQVFVCIAPHICTATVGRVIGFSKAQVLFASPYMHAAMRRDCDGDEAAVMLLMDLLLNFSRKFLPSHRGGTQDAPLVLNTHIKAGEVDDQILDFELGEYPLELYEKAEQGKHSSEIKIENVKKRLKEGNNPFTNLYLTHNCNDINKTVINSSYKALPTMQEKVNSNMKLGKKIRAIDIGDFSRLIVERHFIRDIRGNLRKFSMQEFRCVQCNTKYRRPPLVGKCTVPKCGGRIIFTISEGSILKYMQPALELARKYDASPYLLESLELTEGYIQSIFGKEREKQEALKKWF